MKVNHPSIDISGTHLQGYIHVTYAQLVATLGEPFLFNGKTQAEWHIEQDGVVATVYDYKNYGQNVNSVTDWHIGGFSDSALWLISNLTGLPVETPSQRYARLFPAL